MIARVVLGGLVGVGLGACFTAPGGRVLFSCEPDGRSACPPGYECRGDGCCHDVDTPDGADENLCKLAPGGGTASDTGTGETETGSDTGTASDSGTEPATGSTSDGTEGDTTASSSGDGTSSGDATSSGDGTTSGDGSSGDTGSSTTAAT